MKISVAILIIVFLSLSVSARETVDYPPFVETITTGTTLGFGLTETDDGQTYRLSESCGANCNLDVLNEWGPVAFGSLEYVEVRLRASNDGETFHLRAYDWQNAAYYTVLSVDSTAEETYLVSIPFYCQSGGADCFVNPDRNSNVSVRLRWVDDILAPDAVLNLLTVDVELLRVVMTDEAFGLDEWALRVMILLFVIFAIIGFGIPNGFVLLMSGIVGVFMSFVGWNVTNNPVVLVFFLMFGIVFMVIGIFTAAEQYGDSP